MRKGFTLIELLVVIVIIGILISLALPNYAKAKDKAREAQVLSGLHVIQAALERYATDNDGRYPMWLLGGDWSDWNTVEGMSPVFCPGISRPCGDGDPLLMYGYLNAYPRNPFMQAAALGRQFHVLDCVRPNHPLGVSTDVFCFNGNDYDGRYDNLHFIQDPNTDTCQNAEGTCRRVGGQGTNRMWELSEGGYSFVPLNWTGAYNSFWSDEFDWLWSQEGRGWSGHPPFTVLPRCPPTDTSPECQLRQTKGRVLHPYAVGNFFYWPIWTGTAGYGLSISSSTSDVVRGYVLFAFGAIWNRGHDVIDVFGDPYIPDTTVGLLCERGVNFTGSNDCRIDFEERSFFGTTAYCVHNGPDGIYDGIIGVVASGTDVKVLMDKPKPGCKGII